MVRGYGDLARLRRGQFLVGMLDPLLAPQAAREAAPTCVTAFALELLPRITRRRAWGRWSPPTTCDPR